MPKVHQIYRQLQHLEDVTVDRAMVAALPTADRLALRLMGLLLLQRRHPEGLLGLVLHYHLFAPDIQHTIASHAGEMFRPLRQAAGMSHTHGPLNAIQVIHRSLSARLAYLAADQLRTGSSEAQCAAGACLLHLARHAASDPRPAVMPQIEPRGTDYLQSAVDEAVHAFPRHEQRSVLVAAAWLLMRGSPALRQRLADEQHPATAALAELADEGDQPAIVRHLPLLMSIPTLTAAAATGLERAAARGNLGPMLAQHHLLWLPALATPLSQLEQPERFCLDETQARALAPHEVRGLPVWVASLPLEVSQKIDHLAELRHQPDPATRLMALRRLMREAPPGHDQPATPSPPADARSGPDTGHEARSEPTGAADARLEAIALFCDDPDPQLARIALHHLVRRHYGGLTRLLMRLVNSPHESLRRYATRRLAPIGFARLWDAWPKLDQRRRLAAGRALVKIDDQFTHALGEKLTHGDRTARLRALNMIAELHQGDAFEANLRKLAEEPDEVVASAAVRALGSAGSEQAAHSIEKAMRHADTSVRANAVEAMSQMRSARNVDRHVEELARMSEEDANRPRASAIGALLEMKAGDALPALTRMLEDARPEHRNSALWLVEHMGVLETARTVAELASTDPDPQVRRRAEKVAQEMLSQLHASPQPPSRPAASSSSTHASAAPGVASREPA